MQNIAHLHQNNIVRLSLSGHPLNGRLVRILTPVNCTSPSVMIAPIDNEGHRTPVKPRHLKAA